MSRFVQDLSKAMSQDGASQFQEVILQELELSVKKELEKYLPQQPHMSLSTLKKILMDFGSYFIDFCKKRDRLWTGVKSRDLQKIRFNPMKR